MRIRQSTVYVDYQQRASEFSVGDLAYPLAGGSTDESQAGRVVAVYPAIGQVDIEFAWGSGRYAVEDVQRVTKIVSIPPDPEHTSVPGGIGTVSLPGGPQGRSAFQKLDRLAHAYVKSALYWASKDRHYQATRAELDGGSYTCPKCKQDALKAAIYKRSEGKSERLLGCPSCLFLIKRCHIIGDSDYEEGDYVEELGTAEGLVAGKTAAGTLTHDIWVDVQSWVSEMTSQGSQLVRKIKNQDTLSHDDIKDLLDALDDIDGSEGELREVYNLMQGIKRVTHYRRANQEGLVALSKKDTAMGVSKWRS